MQITNDSVVTVHYRLQRNNQEGDLVEETFNGKPLTFLFGVGQMIPDFERNLEGKNIGDTHSFGITSDNAYGPIDPGAIVELPIETFIINGELAKDMLIVGKTIPMSDDHGRQLMGTVKEVKEKGVLIDFNHPMAGQDLFFTIEVLDVRPATQSEMDHGHVHGPGGEHH